MSDFNVTRAKAARGGMRTLTLILTGALLLFGLVSFQSMIETVAADEIKIIQYPTGTLTFNTQPGWAFQFFGDVTTYPKRGHYDFDGKVVKIDGQELHGARITFNDGAESALSGSIQFDYPLDEENLRDIHTTYGSHEAFSQQLVEVVTDKSIFMTGPLLSSKQSYSENRSDMIRWAEDQVVGGVYRTRTREVTEVDAITGESRTRTVAEIVMDPDTGLPLRQEMPQLAEYGVTPRNFSVTDVLYPERVREQIATQQENIMAVETAIAEAKQAEQRAKTVEEQGRANAARAKWEQEVVKAKAVTEAEQKREVAELDKEAAEFEKAANIARGQGEAERRRLVMAADNALDARLQAYVEVMTAFAVNFKNLPVPQVVMGEAAGGGERAADLISLLTTKVAQDLAVKATPGQR